MVIKLSASKRVDSEASSNKSPSRCIARTISKDLTKALVSKTPDKHLKQITGVLNTVFISYLSFKVVNVSPPDTRALNINILLVCTSILTSHTLNKLTRKTGLRWIGTDSQQQKTVRTELLTSDWQERPFTPNCV